jgi:hypothetical protein
MYFLHAQRLAVNKSNPIAVFACKGVGANHGSKSRFLAENMSARNFDVSVGSATTIFV